MNGRGKSTLRRAIRIAATAFRCLGSGLFLGCAFLGCASLRKFKAADDPVAVCQQLSHDGSAALEAGDCTRARTLLTEAVESNPEDADSRRQLAEALWRQGEQVAAVVQIEKAIKIDPHHAPTLVRAGEMLLESGRAEAALARAERAVAIDPALAGAWALRGQIYRQRGALTAALSDLHQALRYQPNSEAILLATAEIHYQLGKPQQCLTTLHHLLERYPPGEEPQKGLWLEGLAYQASQRPEEAAESLAAAARRGPAPAELLYQLAQAEQTIGRGSAAAEAAHRALATDAAYEPARALLSSLGHLEASGTEVLRR